MPRRQPHSTRRARVGTILLVLAATSLPHSVRAMDSGVVRWFSDAAAPALQSAAPTNDVKLAGRELLNRGFDSAFTRMQQAGPTWLKRVGIDLSFDPAFQPRYTVAATQPLLAIGRRETSIDLHGRVIYDASGRTGGDMGLRYQGRWYRHPVMVGVRGAVEDRWLEELQRYSLGAELGLSSLDLRATLYDDDGAHPATEEIADRRLDGYDLEVSAPLPFVPWARLRASRFRQLAVDGDAVDTCDRVSIRLAPLSPLEIESGMQSEAENRSWFTQLRWRIKLGE